MVRPDRETTKVRIVFDASAKLNEKSLNTEALPSPKLQSNIFDILVRFRKELGVLVGDVSQMYHQLVLKPEDRPFHRFPWQNLDVGKYTAGLRVFKIRLRRVLLPFLCPVHMAKPR